MVALTRPAPTVLEALACGAPLVATTGSAVEEVVERHSHAIIIGRVLDVTVSPRTAALAYWQGQYVAIDRDEDRAEIGASAGVEIEGVAMLPE